jgi:predicted Fe-Mo cluster-binding NifX family protein
MKAAFSVWENRIAPVFDVARQMHLVEAKAGRIVSEREEAFPDDFPLRKAIRLAELGIDILICGAVSRPLRETIAAYGIRVIPFVAGELGDVKCAWLSGGEDIRRFAMPGCCGRRKRGSKSLEAGKEDCAMRGRNRGGTGQDAGTGQGAGTGRGGQGRGRTDGPFVAGPGGNCVCPSCGHQEPHAAGVPCLQKQCPKCGTAMARG